MKRFVLSDSHGGYRAIRQCLERCGFNQEQDQLFFIGDVVDGWSETKESIALLLTIPNLIYLLGNHDQWALQYYTGNFFSVADENDAELDMWLVQGGAATLKSYGLKEGIPAEHLQFLLNAKSYHVTPDNILLVHAGFDPEMDLAKTNSEYLIWSRNFIKQHYQAYHKLKRNPFSKEELRVAPYKEIYLGHTPTISFEKKQTLPLTMGNVILMDTGAAFTGRLSVMDMDTKEVWQSDQLIHLYPDEPGRNGISWRELRSA
ncbi:metallophosphoesterase [Adhaeribacter pallidiroseus]|uniref:Protein-serine/threonine phosphatase n=1 Tax=Adhaeribacter pallidiroseus TaxID=2072847 RepID=A0A369QGA6_9BACT|nr:metallophosphoesterase [Adhaeribacter pallidiroseus]RDC61929.1 Protein-serine/threonine phosphatase [Adhaeribacter pallidiroseus]